jgi:hypothetical protein
MIALEERDRNRDGIRDTQLRFYYTRVCVCKSTLTFTLAFKQKFESKHLHIRKNIDPLIMV